MRSLFALTIFFLCQSAAVAIDLPVEYLADFKEFKRNAIAGDSLSFDLFDNDTCTGPVTHAELKFVGGAGLTVEKTLPQKAKGQKPSPTKGVRLHTSLSPAAVEEQLYLKVTGTGVVALRDECQVQIAGVPGPEGPAGPPGDAAEVMHVFDGSGNDIGIRMGSLNDLSAYRPSLDATLPITKFGTLDAGPSHVYELPGCLGQGYYQGSKALLSANVVYESRLVPGTYVIGTTTVVSSTYESVADPGGICQATGPANDPSLIPFAPIVIDLTFPLPLPMRIGPASP